jgi:Glycosyltransferases involved in cell wall biogenesis
MKLSIIVPVYNVEAFLKKCVDSLLAQDLPKEDYEVILVDDGSTDGGGMLCDTLAAEHGNIRVIHQRNRGLSGARNSGIPVASGDYVMFVDSDDFLCPNVLGTLVGLMDSKELDILRFNYQNVNMDGAVFEPNKYVKPFVDYSDEVCDGETFLNERLGNACYAWQFLVKASLLRQEGNGFKEGIYFEDVEWTPRILIQVGRVASTETVVYNYLFRSDSIARNTDTEKKRKAIRDKLVILDGFNSLERQMQDNRWIQSMRAHTALAILYSVGRFFYPERKEYIRALRGKVAFPLSTYHSTRSARRKIRVANLSPSLVCWLYHRK